MASFSNIFVLFLPKILLSVSCCNVLNVSILLSRLFVRSKSVAKCSTGQSFTRTKVSSYRIGTLTIFHMVLTLDNHKIFLQLIQCLIRDAPLTFGPPLAHYISSSLALFSFWWKMRVNDKRDSIFTLGSKMHFMSPLALWVSFSLLIFQSPWDHPYITSAKKGLGW